MPSSMSGLAIGAALRKKAKKHMRVPAMTMEKMYKHVGSVMSESEYNAMRLPKRYTTKQMLERAKRNAGV